MAENKLPFREGTSINKPPMFSGVIINSGKLTSKSLLNLLTVGFGMQLLMVHLFPCLL